MHGILLISYASLKLIVEHCKWFKSVNESFLYQKPIPSAKIVLLGVQHRVNFSIRADVFKGFEVKFFFNLTYESGCPKITSRVRSTHWDFFFEDDS